MKKLFKFFFRLLLLAGLIAIGFGAYYAFQLYQNEQTTSRYLQQLLKEQNKQLANMKKDKAQVTTASSTDRDGDGLSSAEEEKLGTSDNNPDTDGDGIIDFYDKHPIGGGRNIVKELNWEFDRSQYKMTVPIPADAIAYYEQLPRPEWSGSYDYYAQFVDRNDQALKTIAAELKGIINKESYSKRWAYYDKVMFVASLVQHVSYVSDKLTGFDDYTKYPLQTIADGNGDCEDAAILTAALLHEMGFDAKLVFLEISKHESHMGVAALGNGEEKGTSWKQGNKQFYYIETTDPRWSFGELPPQWKNSEFYLIDLP